MQYQITVKPGKEEAFEQLLQSWQTLGVVVEYAKVTDQDELSEGFDRHSGGPKPKSTTAAQDFTFNYRDLVD